MKSIKLLIKKKKGLRDRARIEKGALITIIIDDRHRKEVKCKHS